MPPDPKVHVGVGAVVPYRDMLLMVQRGGQGAYASDGHGTWSVPGGWLDFDEDPFGAAEREVLEETGIEVEAKVGGGFVHCNSYNGKYDIVTLFIWCEYVSGDPTITEPDKCPVVEWVPVREIRSRPLFAPVEKWLK